MKNSYSRQVCKHQISSPALSHRRDLQGERHFQTTISPRADDRGCYRCQPSLEWLVSLSHHVFGRLIFRELECDLFTVCHLLPKVHVCECRKRCQKFTATFASPYFPPTASVSVSAFTSEALEGGAEAAPPSPFSFERFLPPRVLRFTCPLFRNCW